MKISVQEYKKSINESNYSAEQIAVIWDFYVTKSFANSASQKRTISDYGHKQFPFQKILQTAHITRENHCELLADKMPKTLEKMGLKICKNKSTTIPIDIDTPRFAFIRDYTISDGGKPTAKSGNSKPESLFRHIRNALAHGNTYFFDNGNMLLEDKITLSNTITAMILIEQRTLLDWIKLIDYQERYYHIIDHETKNEN